MRIRTNRTISMKPTVFLSYSRSDLDQMLHVKDSLIARGINVWTDELLQPGTPQWENEIAFAIESSKALVVLLSPRAKESVWVGRELSYAEEHEVRIFPVLLDGDEKTSVPFRLISTQRIDLRTGFASGMRALVEALKVYLDLHFTEKTTSKEMDLSLFLANSIHDMRTPLSVINMQLSMIQQYRERMSQETVDRHLSRAQSALGMLSSILDDVQTLSRVDRNLLPVPDSPVNAVAILQSLFDTYTTIGEQKDVSMSFVTSSDNGPVLIDENQLRRAIGNILINAVSYTPSGGQVDVSIMVKLSEIMISIEDTGIGIPKEDQEHIFKRFYRSTNAEITQSGTGLGLAISKEIVENYGGRIWFSSEVGKGTLFKITFPLHR